jgi:curved DNA-binding protein CbpA
MRAVTAGPIVRNAYSVLGVDRDSDDVAIAAAYRRLARRYHPDIAGEAATVRMSAINAAFDLIRTPERRAEYDLQLAADGITMPSTKRWRPKPAEAPRPTASWVPSEPRTEWSSDRDGTGGAGPPPGRPSGSVLSFGRHVGWSIGEIARADPGYLVWLEERREGRPYLAEIDRTLRAVGYRHDPEPYRNGSRFFRR